MVSPHVLDGVRHHFVMEVGEADARGTEHLDGREHVEPRPGPDEGAERRDGGSPALGPKGPERRRRHVRHPVARQVVEARRWQRSLSAMVSSGFTRSTRAVDR